VNFDNLTISMMRNIAWTLSNFSRGKDPCPRFEVVVKGLPTLGKLLFSTDEEVLADTLWAFSFLSESGGSECIDAILAIGVCQRLTDLLFYNNYAIVCPALRTIGNICTGNETQTQEILNCPILSALINLLNDSLNISLKKEICWVLSNIAAGNKSHSDYLLNNLNIVQLLIAIAIEEEISVKREAMWVLCNLLRYCTYDQAIFFLSHKVLLPLCHMIKNFKNDYQMALCCLEGLTRLLNLISDNDEYHQEAIKVLVEEEGFISIAAIGQEKK